MKRDIKLCISGRRHKDRDALSVLRKAELRRRRACLDRQKGALNCGCGLESQILSEGIAAAKSCCLVHEALCQPSVTMGTFLDVKHWPVIRQPERYAGKKLFIGFVTDLYSRRSRPIGVLVPCSGTGVKLTIAAKNDLSRAFSDARVSLPVNTLDEAFKNDMDDAVSIARWLDVS